MPVLMVAAGLAAFAVSLPAAAQFAKPEDAIRYRRGALTVMAAPLAKMVWNSADSTLLSPRRAARAP